MGVGLGEQDLAFWLEMLEHVGPQGMPSMRQDLLFGRKTEVELFAGTITRLGRLHGVPTPTNDRLLQRIHQMEAALGVSR